MLERLRHIGVGLTRRGRFESGLDSEVQFHIDQYVADLVRSGVPEAEAYRRARIQFGSVETVKEECRQARGLQFLDQLSQDLRYTARTMLRSPGFASAAILSLALGIGVNTAIFSLMDAVLLRTMPVGKPNELFVIGHGAVPGATNDDGRIQHSSNYALFEMLRTRAEAFNGITASIRSRYKVDAGSGVQTTEGELVSENFHAVLQVPFAVGRGFAAGEDKRHNPVAVISHRLWTDRFSNDPEILGRTIYVNGLPVTIVGVTAPEYFGISPGYPVDISVSMSLAPQLQSADFFTTLENWTNLTLIGRLKPEVALQQAEAEVTRLLTQFIDQPGARWVRQMSPTEFQAARLEPASKGLSDLRRKFSQPLWVLFGIVVLVLAVSCANTSSLLLARAGARQKEIAVRLSLGIARGRLLRQLLTESVTLSLAGGLLGALLAFWCTNLLLQLFRAGSRPVELNVVPNLRVLAFTAATAVACGLLFGLAPAAGALRVDYNSALKGLAGAGSRFRAGKAIVAVQVGICMLLLTAAGLLTQTLVEIQNANYGFRRDNLLLVTLDTWGTPITPEQAQTSFEEVRRRVQALPGVQSVSLSDTSPISVSEGGNQRLIVIPGRVTRTTEEKVAWTPVVSPGYLETFGVELLHGRTLSNSDTPGRPHVAILNEAATKKFFAGSNPLGKHFFFGTNKTPVEVVGIVRNTAQHDPRVTSPEIVYTPLAQFDESPSTVVLAIRSAGDPVSLVAALRAEVRAVNKNIAIQYVRTMRDQIAVHLLNETLLARLSGLFAILAATLACIGLYGVMAYSVTRRTHEMGVRMALGATPRSVRWLVIRQALTVVAAGLAIGIPAALFVTRWLEGLLFRVTPDDPMTYATVAAVLIGATFIAAYLPARGASRVNPTQALRIE